MKGKKIIATAMAALMLAGCGGSGTKGVEYTAKFDTKNYRDYILAGSDFESLNYLTSNLAVDGRLNQNLIDKLVQRGVYGEDIPALAESWEHNEDCSVWTFHLRKGVKWYTVDKEEYGEVTADDFVYSVEYILDPVNVSLNTEMTFLIDGAKEYYTAKSEGKDAEFSTVGVKALDDYTVQYTMANGGKPYFISAVHYNSFAPANRKFIESIPDQDGEPGTKRYGSNFDLMLYCGPYIIEKDTFVRDNSKTLLKNEGYWDKDNVPFDTVTILSIKDEESSLEYLERGEVGRANLSATQVIAQQNKNNPYLIQMPLASSVYGLLLNGHGTYEGAENTNKAIYNLNFRKALYYGVDADQYNEVAVPGDVSQVRGYGYTAAGYLFTEDGTDYTQLGDLAKHHAEYHYNPELAKEYAAKAREELEAEGVTFPIKLMNNISASSEVESNKQAVLESILEETLGSDFIDVCTDYYATSWFAEACATGNFTFTVKGWGPDYQDPINILNTMTSHSGQVNDRVTFWEDATFDKMVADADAIVDDLTARYTAFANAEAYFLDQAYFIPMTTNGGSYYITTVNRYSKEYNNGDSFRYVGWEAMDHVITAEENEEFKAKWEAGRAAALGK